METDFICSDFGVEKLFSRSGLSMYGAQKGELWHFLWVSKEESDDGSLDFLISQLHIPRYLLATALERQLNFVEQLGDAAGGAQTLHATAIGWDGWSLGVTVDHEVLLVAEKTNKTYTLREVFDELQGDLELLAKSRDQVAIENGQYVLSDELTNGGNPVASGSKELIEAIAFERLVYGYLDPVQIFELFSAFCTLVDSPLSNNFPASYIARLVEEQQSIDIDEVSETIRDLFRYVQEDRLDGAKVWGADLDPTDDDLIPKLKSELDKLTDVQRCQFVLLRDLHHVVMLFGLAFVYGALTLEDYCSLMTEASSPDSEFEQTLRSQSAFIELLSVLA